MGNIVPVASQAVSAINTVSKAVDVIRPITNIIGKTADFFGDRDQRSDLTLSQLQQSQALEQQRAAQNAALQQQTLAEQTAQAEADRRAALKRAVARQRVQFGASGISSAGGSSEAVLLGLFDESDAERAERERLDTLKSQAIDQNLENTTRVNTLQLAQLQERNNLQNSVSAFDTAREFLDIF